MLFRTKKNKKLVLIISMVLVLGFVMSLGWMHRVSAVNKETYEKLKMFTDVLSIVQKNYVEEIDTEKLLHGAINGMLEALDPHSSFMPPDVFKEMKLETRGVFGGLGIEITKQEGTLMVISPIEDTPAYRAGIKAGDYIVKINGKPTKDMGLMDAVKLMRGPAGTQITISILRKGLSGPKDFTITRAVIKIESVKYKVLEEGYGYIRIKSFQDKTSNELKDALNKLETEKNSIKGLILDLRNNPGGPFDQALKVSDEFLDSGIITYTEERAKGSRKEYKAHGIKKPRDYPIIVLVNAGSASASEIVAGALQDHGRALILGVQTFGKATVQSIYSLEDGSGLKLTIGRYYTPKGRSIQAKGITPDIVVPDRIPSGTEEERKIRFLREKDLDRHFESTTEGKEKEDALKEVKEDKTSEDAQLDRALELLKSWYVFGKNAKVGN
ncbi:MAG: S41 family peptidase [Deltaproteobacteria bacterium]|jgi:carboxyl-terminal processing protease|nr:MAG: S41 family peptidase [Deltaproteobacteria bacterium]